MIAGGVGLDEGNGESVGERGWLKATFTYEGWLCCWYLVVLEGMRGNKQGYVDWWFLVQFVRRHNLYGKPPTNNCMGVADRLSWNHRR